MSTILSKIRPLKRKPEDTFSPLERGRRKIYRRGVMEEQLAQFSKTGLKVTVEKKDEKGHVTHEEQHLLPSFQMAKSIAVAGAPGWNLGKIAPVIKENILALQEFARIADIYVMDLGPDHPATKKVLADLQNAALQLIPRAINEDMKNVNIIEHEDPQLELLKQLAAKQFGLDFTARNIATHLSKGESETEQ